MKGMLTLKKKTSQWNLYKADAFGTFAIVHLIEGVHLSNGPAKKQAERQ